MVLQNLDVERLASLLNEFIPADDFPSALDAGAIDFLESALAERPEWRVHVEGALAGEATDLEWLSNLVQIGYYADPSQGGNREAVSWRMVGWKPGPPGWPPAEREALLPPTRRLADLADSYDAVVIGSGAGGGPAAAVLSEAGLAVLVVERGDAPDAQHLSEDHLRNARVNFGFQDRSLPLDIEEPRIVEGRLTVPSEFRWGANAMTVGGGTRIYGAQAWRFDPVDFRMATHYGVPDESSLADWPISYEELAPWYSLAERSFGVAGQVDKRHGPPREPYPMPPALRTRPGHRLAVGARKLGWDTLPVPLAINSVPYGGRDACVRCAQCVGFACPVDAKAGSQNTFLMRAHATGRCHFARLTRAVRVHVNAASIATGVTLVDERTRERREVRAGLVIVSAGAVETARLLLASATDAAPAGLGNRTDQVGRHLQGHLYAGAFGVFDDDLNDFRGPGPQIATTGFRHDNAGLIGGGMIANEFVPTPVSTYAMLRAAGLLPPWGLTAKQAMRTLTKRVHRVIGPVQEVPNPASRVELDWTQRDHAGMPVVRLSGANHPEDRRMQAFLTERASEWLTASGAHTTVGWTTRPPGWGPSVGQHQAGTARMGDDPATSVTDPLGRVWGHPNVLVTDTSLHVTNGGVNPMLTTIALALRVAHHAAGTFPTPPGLST
ncbi:GMC family oxidoreductase [Microbacterium sp. LMI12-1-1.1]|uniref:GMC family oxidoreductase n=1 Tax=Microbacterium sp. LMI12-1-1.1 TaxID=3135225 RepID=UPI00341F0D8D